MLFLEHCDMYTIEQLWGEHDSQVDAWVIHRKSDDREVGMINDKPPVKVSVYPKAI